jgi:anti-sigma factor ChrR (cupin superfamily)
MKDANLKLASFNLRKEKIMSMNWQEKGVRFGNIVLSEDESRVLVMALVKEVRHISWLMEEILDVESGVKDVLSKKAQKALVEFAMRTPEVKTLMERSS